MRPAALRYSFSCTAASPHSGAAFGLWAELKRLEGDEKTADLLQQRAEDGGATNYAEVAALYFQLAWQDNRPGGTQPV